MEDKVYNFDFGSKRKKIVSYVFAVFIFLVASFGIDAFAIYGISWLSARTQNEEIITYLACGIFIITLAFKISGIVVQFLPRKIVLTDDTIEIKYNNSFGFLIRFSALVLNMKNWKAVN